MIPRHILHNMNLLTGRLYKAQKRRQLRTALQAVGELRRGCVAMPEGSRLISEATRALEKLQTNCRAIEWGR